MTFRAIPVPAALADDMAAGASIASIVRKYGISTNTARKWFRAAGELQKRMGHRHDKIRAILDAYAKGVLAKEIACLYGIEQSYVSHLVLKHRPDLRRNRRRSDYRVSQEAN